MTEQQKELYEALMRFGSAPRGSYRQQEEAKELVQLLLPTHPAPAERSAPESSGN